MVWRLREMTALILSIMPNHTSKMKETTNEQWEYTTRLNPSHEELRYLGNQGWEAYHVDIDDSYGSMYCLMSTYYFKRRKGGAR